MQFIVLTWQSKEMHGLPVALSSWDCETDAAEAAAVWIEENDHGTARVVKVK